MGKGRSTVLISKAAYGPLMALDLATIPDRLKDSLVSAAVIVDIHIGMGEVTAGAHMREAEAALMALSAGLKELDALYLPVLMDNSLDSFPEVVQVIRNGATLPVPQHELTRVERHAAVQLLLIQSAAAKRRADELQALASQLEIQAVSSPAGEPIDVAIVGTSKSQKRRSQVAAAAVDNFGTLTAELDENSTDWSAAVVAVANCALARRRSSKNGDPLQLKVGTDATQAEKPVALLPSRAQSARCSHFGKGAPS